MPNTVNLDDLAQQEKPKQPLPIRSTALAIVLLAVAAFLLYRAFFTSPPTVPQASDLERQTRLNLEGWLIAINQHVATNNGRFPALSDLTPPATNSPHDTAGAIDPDYAIHPPAADIVVTPGGQLIITVVDLAAAIADPPVLAVGLIDGSVIYADTPEQIFPLLQIPENAWLLEATKLNPDDFKP